jgi:hypothetical protein
MDRDERSGSSHSGKEQLWDTLIETLGKQLKGDVKLTYQPSGFAHFIERADAATLEDAPEALNRFCVHRADDILALDVLDDLMLVALDLAEVVISSCIAGFLLSCRFSRSSSPTLVRWHRAGFRCYWRWKSLPLGGRPQIDTKLRALIRRMSMETPLWGAPRIHGELLKLGFEVAQSSVAKNMAKRRAPPRQGWRTFLRNHAPDIAAMDLFVVPTIGFDLLYAIVIVRFDAETSSGSTSQQIRRPNGLHVR